MRDRIRNVAEEVLSRNWGILKRTSFDFLRRDGQWQHQVRETYDHGPAAAVLLHCPERETVILVRQFRFPIYATGKDGWLLEVCAGLLDGDDPETCARREAEEEAGFRVNSLREAFAAEMSPGSVIETITCFVGTYDAASRVSAGGGLHAEGEDIEVVELPLSEALEMLEDGRITDAKTILLLQWLALHPIRQSAG
ncbi:MAG: NUDIX domain-containing protein [Devosia sp.]|nr:NUDIX domain-containing protein [Devosia sp.]